jgi:protease inhibitor Inh
MAVAARVIVALPWRLAALGAVLAFAGCGETVNNSLFDQLAASPRVPMPERASQIVPKASDMGGRWMLTMPGTGTCGMAFEAAAVAGAVAPEGGCPGKFFTSRKWAIERDGVVIRDHNGQPLAELRMAEPGRLEGLTPDNEQILLTR